MIYLPNKVLRWSIRRTYMLIKWTVQRTSVSADRCSTATGRSQGFTAEEKEQQRILHADICRARARGKVGRFGPGRRRDVDGHIRQGCCPSGWYVRTDSGAPRQKKFRVLLRTLACCLGSSAHVRASMDGHRTIIRNIKCIYIYLKVARDKFGGRCSRRDYFMFAVQCSAAQGPGARNTTWRRRFAQRVQPGQGNNAPLVRLLPVFSGGITQPFLFFLRKKKLS